jgi:hypothetical protein
MVGFYDDLIACRPARIQDLYPDSSGEYWRREEMRRREQDVATTATATTTRQRLQQRPNCTLCEYMDVWASPEEILALLHDQVELAHLVDVFSQTARQVIETCHLLRSSDEINHPLGTASLVWLMSCKGCNRHLDEVHSQLDDVVVGRVSEMEDFCSFVHLLLSIFGVLNHLLLQAPEHCDSLVLVLTPQPTNGQALEPWRMDRCMYHDIWIVVLKGSADLYAIHHSGLFSFVPYTERMSLFLPTNLIFWIF